MQCTTPNVIYLLTCNICKKQYVGETKRAFVVRMKEHLADIRLKRDKPVANHIDSHSQSTKSVIPQIIEVSWIYRLKTLILNVLNKLGC